MEEIVSKDGSTLLHKIFRKEDFVESRADISPEEEYLQLSSLRMDKGKTFKPHKHIIHEKLTDIAQESWVVVQGRVKAILYDLDDQIIREVVLNPGDISITYRGGHNYLILEDDTLVYEYKTGPYLGQKLDKTFID
jgi:cupin fold WbuC family metalloprotein